MVLIRTDRQDEKESYLIPLQNLYGCVNCKLTLDNIRRAVRFAQVLIGSIRSEVFFTKRVSTVEKSRQNAFYSMSVKLLAYREEVDIIGINNCFVSSFILNPMIKEIRNPFGTWLPRHCCLWQESETTQPTIFLTAGATLDWLGNRKVIWSRSTMKK